MAFATDFVIRLGFDFSLSRVFHNTFCFVVADVVKANRKEIQKVLIIAANEPYEASFRISYVDDELVLEMSDQTLNSIMIPIACLVVVIMTAIILSLEARKLVNKKISSNCKWRN